MKDSRKKRPTQSVGNNNNKNNTIITHCGIQPYVVVADVNV